MSTSASASPQTSPLRENFPSPNAIPPRTSSLNLGYHNPLRHAPPHAPQKPVLRPQPEAEWISQSKHSTSGGGLERSKSGAGPSSAAPDSYTQKLSEKRRKTKSSPQMATERLQTQVGSIDETVAGADRDSFDINGNGTHTKETQPEETPRRKSPVDALPTWTSQKESILLSPYTYLENHPGKDIRSQLIAAFNAWLQVPKESLAVITRVVGMLHTSSLLIDDVEDSSMLRRGVPVAHSIFGTAQTINSANYVYFLALQNLTGLHNPECSSIFVEELLNLHRGQGMDLFWRDTLTCPTEADYLEMVGNKTGGLFRLAVKLMMAESGLAKAGKVPDCVPLVSTIGLLFQILDDYLNLQSTAYTERKGLCEDLTEGKFSFPVIHAIRSQQPEQTNGVNGNGMHQYPSAIAQPPMYHNNILINILKQKTHDEEVKRYAVRYMEERGSFKYTGKVIGELREEALKLVEVVQEAVGGEAGDIGAKGLRMILEKLRVE